MIDKYIKMKKYDDMIYLPHRQSDKRPRMSNYDRAAQFSPFAALTGYDDAVSETARLTEEEADLSEDALTALDFQIAVLSEHVAERPEILVTYFRPDEKKAGGAYLTCRGRLEKIDCSARVLFFTDGGSVPFSEIVKIESPYFNGETL